MNFFRNELGHVYLQQYSSEKKRTVKLPREQSRHLDVLSDDEIKKLVAKPMSDNPKLFEGLPIRKYFEQWEAFLKARGYDPATVRQHKYYVENFIFPFFSKVKKPDAKEWPAYGARLYNWLEKEGASGKPATASQIKSTNIALRKFYDWLSEEGHVPAQKLKLRSAIDEVKPAVLPRPVLPEEVLRWAETCEVPHVKIMGLVGYFFSLRPQEVFALIKADFQAGEQIMRLECSQVMRKAELFDRLVVHVGRQQQNSGTIVNSAKKGSNGWVACFNLDAAKRIIGILNGLEAPGSKLCGWNNHKLYTDWKKHGIEGVNVKDLRRASLYYLGHYSKLSPMQVMKHARHRNIETTMIYCRRPDEILGTASSTLSLGLDE